MGWRERQRDRNTDGDHDAPVCQSRRKDLYPDEESAWADVPAKTRKYYTSLRPYECRHCDGWHLTSHPTTPDGEPGWTPEDLARRWNTRP